MARYGDRTTKTTAPRPRRRSRSHAIGRAFSLLALAPVASRAPAYARLIWSLLRDERLSVSRKAVLAGALGYLVLGRDLVPDWLPLVGGIDDLVVAVLALELFLDGVPDDVLNENLERVGMEPERFERDIEQVHRLTPGPVRRTIKRLSTTIDVGGGAWQTAGMGPKIRTWLKEERTA